ncbi:MAG TPA: efflux RND transporter periplasmic adaptor subunit [Thermoanaerobaculia bacterium]|nr:efflux RND transporter periplasmic adaptor subunit [Thermoanaerobaculia bacterium]
MNRFQMPAGRVAARFTSVALPVLACLALVGCGAKKTGPGAPGAGAGAPPPPAQVTVVSVVPRTVPVPYELTGRIEGSREIEVRARVSGILLERSYEEGRPIRKGQTLFVIDPAEYRAEVRAAQASLAEEQAKLARSQRDVARLEPLLAAHATPRKDYDNALSDVDEAKATVQAAQARLDQAKLNLSYTRVEAPISGVSSRAEKSEGSLVGPGENGLLTRISQVQPIWVRFSAADQTMRTLREGIESGKMSSPGNRNLEVELVLPDGSVHPERGRVNFADSLIDPATGSQDWRAQLPNATSSLVPGQFVRVRLLGVERPNAILVPQRAVQQSAEGKFVFVVGADGKAVAKPIVAGDWLGQDWIINSGLASGDRVIVDGVVKVQPGAPVQVVDAAAPAADAAKTGADAAGGKN